MRNNYAPNGRQSHCLTSETANTMNPEKWSKDGDGPLIATMPVAAMLGVAGVISLSEDWMTALKEIRENIIGSLVVWVVGSLMSWVLLNAIVLMVWNIIDFAVKYWPQRLLQLSTRRFSKLHERVKNKVLLNRTTTITVAIAATAATWLTWPPVRNVLTETWVCTMLSAEQKTDAARVTFRGNRRRQPLLVLNPTPIAVRGTYFATDISTEERVSIPAASVLVIEPGCKRWR